jgi:hypothetical protein
MFVLSLATSAWLVHRLQGLELERSELLGRLSELRDHAARDDRAAESRRKRDELVERMRQIPGGALDLAAVRELLIASERGLDVDRISLDFRPESSLPEGRVGGAIDANLVGSFDAVYEYLRRVEMLRLPLSAGEYTLRGDPDGRLLLTVRYRALWELERGAGGQELSPSDVALLELWLSDDSEPPPERNPFAEATARFPAAPEPMEPVAAPPEPDVIEPARDVPESLPRLSGYVLARPELEADVSSRILAAIRFEGELRLVKVGDSLGPYRVERIAARERVVLVDERTGERLELSLE